MNDEHRVCELERKIAVLEAELKGAATALIIADRVAASDRRTWIAMALALLAFAVHFIK
jgi:hypothetical protein